VHRLSFSFYTAAAHPERTRKKATAINLYFFDIKLHAKMQFCMFLRFPILPLSFLFAVTLYR